MNDLSDIYRTTRRRTFTAEELDELLVDVDELIDQASQAMFIHRTMDLLVQARAAIAQLLGDNRTAAG